MAALRFPLVSYLPVAPRANLSPSASRVQLDRRLSQSCAVVFSVVITPRSGGIGVGTPAHLVEPLGVLHRMTERSHARLCTDRKTADDRGTGGRGGRRAGSAVRCRLVPVRDVRMGFRGRVELAIEDDGAVGQTTD